MQNYILFLYCFYIIFARAGTFTKWEMWGRIMDCQALLQQDTYGATLPLPLYVPYTLHLPLYMPYTLPLPHFVPYNSAHGVQPAMHCCSETRTPPSAHCLCSVQHIIANGVYTVIHCCSATRTPPCLCPPMSCTVVYMLLKLRFLGAARHVRHLRRLPNLAFAPQQNVQ